MGKRELLIIAGFLVAGVLVYQVTAPPSTGSSGFSFSNLFSEVRREVRGNPGRATTVHTQVLPVGPAVREVRILRVAQTVSVVGEDRTDVEYALTVSSNGPDDATAQTYIDRTVFARDDVADSLILRVTYPDEGRQETSAIVKVPARMAVRVENSVGITITGVAAAHVEAARGPVTLTNIAGTVTGAHQDADLTITKAKAVKMRLSRLRSRFEHVTDGLILDVRDGECTILKSAGAVEIESQRAEIRLTGHAGPVTVRGSDGRVLLDDPGAETTVDMRRAEVDVTMSRPVPVTVITTDQSARLIVKHNSAFELDALSLNGRIQATDVNLTAENVGQDMKLVHTFGVGRGPRVTVRNTRGEIVVRK